MSQITVQELLTERGGPFQLQLVTGEQGINNKISIPRIQKPGLALAGYRERIHPDRIQILGVTELGFLSTLAPGEAEQRICEFCELPIACVIVTTKMNPPPALVRCCVQQHIPILKTVLLSSFIIGRITSYLDERLAPETTIYGVLVEVHGIGVLILGRSGIGKSECALELIARGHRLVADDAVNLRLRAGETIVGSCPELGKYLLEIRGVGLLDIKELFGITAVIDKKKVGLVVKLDNWNKGSYERLGLECGAYNILGADLPLVTIPVGVGRNLAIIIEVATRNRLLKSQGYNTAQIFEQKLNRKLKLDSELATKRTDNKFR